MEMDTNTIELHEKVRRYEALLFARGAMTTRMNLRLNGFRNIGVLGMPSNKGDEAQ